MKCNILNLLILLDSAEVPAWQYHLIEQVLASDHVSLSIVAMDPTDHPRQSKAGVSALFDAIERYDYRRSGVHLDACETKSVIDLVETVAPERRPRLSICHTPREWNELCIELAGARPDIILALGRLQSIDPLSKLAILGVWYFWHDFSQTHMVNGLTVGFWEVLKNRAHMRSALLIKRPHEARAVVACESYSAVHFSSPVRTRNEHLWKILYFVPRALQRVQEIGSDAFLQSAIEHENEGPTLSIDDRWSLSSGNLVKPVLRYAFRRIWLKLERAFFSERWALMFSATGGASDESEFQLIIPPAGRFWADPFAFQKGDSSFIFFEDASINTGRGHISVISVERDGTLSPPVKILDKPYHLSYPFVFEWDGATYLVPESGENRSIELYRCIEFPHRWEFVHNLIGDLSAYDATFVEHNQTWWMFVNVQQTAGSSTWDELCLFYSDSPISRDWQPHVRNPVVSDVRSARPAGRLFLQDGHLHRPSQDSSFRYGYAININKIIELTTTTYREHRVRRIEPNWSCSIKGVHTLNSTDRLTVIDVMHRSRKVLSNNP